MWVVFCSRDDSSAHWAVEGIMKRGLLPLELVTSDDLTTAVHWVHRVSTNAVHTEFQLADGREICSSSIRGVLNRLSIVPSPLFAVAKSSDRKYAEEEFTAFFVSWLQSLPAPTLNRPIPPGLSGAWRHPSEWLYLASKAGLDTSTYRQSSRNGSATIGYSESAPSPEGPTKTLFVVGQEIVGGPAPTRVADGCRQLARLCNCSLLGVEFVASTFGSWVCKGASALPDLRIGGDGLLDALASTLWPERRKR
jgi:hypothetical protein